MANSTKIRDYAGSLQFRDDINRFIRKALEQLRPAPRYAITAGTAGAVVDPTTGTVDVVYNGETDPITVSAPGVKPYHVGAQVRIEGTPTDRYVSDVITPGEAQQQFGRVLTNLVAPATGTAITISTTTLTTNATTLTGFSSAPQAISVTPNTNGTVAPQVTRYLGKFCMLSGQVILKAALTTTAVVLGTLPTGYRPLHSVGQVCAGGGNSLVVITIDTAGSIKVIVPSGQPTPASTTVYLDGVSFIAAT